MYILLPISSLSDYNVMSTIRPTILLIDDLPDTLLILGNILSDTGYEVVDGENGLSALERTRSQPSSQKAR